MPSPKSHRRGGGEEKNRKGRLSEKSSSFHGHNSETVVEVLRRPRTVPDLFAGISGGGASVRLSIPELSKPKLTKLLLNVTIQRSLGALMVLISPESTVEDLIAAALCQYVKEGRRPLLPATNPSGFDLHYSQFSLESMDREEKLIALGSRNLYICPKKVTTSSICSKQAETASSSFFSQVHRFLALK